MSYNPTQFQILFILVRKTKRKLYHTDTFYVLIKDYFKGMMDVKIILFVYLKFPETMASIETFAVCR